MRYSVMLMSTGEMPHKLTYPMNMYHFSTKEKVLEALTYIANLLGNEYKMTHDDNVYKFTKDDGGAELIMVVQVIQWDVLLSELKINQAMP